MDDNVTQMPPEILIKAGQSQRDRMVLEVMNKLWNMLPDRDNEEIAFTLDDGTKCILKKFSKPKYREHEGEVKYGFDVKMIDGKLDHMEFSVSCTGWGMALAQETE